VTVAQSPEDTPIVAWATAGLDGAGGAWLNWTRANHRLGGQGSPQMAAPIVFRADIIASVACWRPSAAWMQSTYPAFFEVCLHKKKLSELQR
jgi:hypothetical protein